MRVSLSSLRAPRLRLCHWMSGKKLVPSMLRALCSGCRESLSLLAEDSGGAIVNLASVGGTFASPLAMPYGASKAAVIQMTKTVALYAASKRLNVRCNSVLPGTIETKMCSTFLMSNARRMPLLSLLSALVKQLK